MTSMTDYCASISKTEPWSHLSPALQALWWTRKGDWEQAHELVQQHEGDPDCDLVHAHLHRQEGNLVNAAQWYGLVDRPVPDVPLSDEWDAITTELLVRSRSARPFAGGA